ncbi:MAG: TIGR03936 family radical SAM-associated protein, partial [Bacillota bacterium]
MERLSFSFARKIELAYISHLDMMRLLLRALHRSGLPLAYSQGYNPHPRLTLALPLPLGVTASEEFGEVFFTEPVGS